MLKWARNISSYSCKSLQIFLSTKKKHNGNIKFSQIIAVSLLCVTGCALGRPGYYLLPLVNFCISSFHLFLSLSCSPVASLALSSFSAVSVTLSSHSLSQGESKLRETLSFVCKEKAKAISQIWEPSTAIWSWLGEMWIIFRPMHLIWWMAFFFDRERHTEKPA